MAALPLVQERNHGLTVFSAETEAGYVNLATTRSAAEKRIMVLRLFLLAVMLWHSPAVAQQRPLVTEDPEPVGSGLILVESGVDYLREQPYPVSGLRGHLVRVPAFGFSIGLGSIAEVQVDGVSYQRLRVLERVEAPLSDFVNRSGDTTSDMDDVVVGTKTRLLSETDGRPAIALRFATRLPNASNESGLGLDTMDFLNTVLIGKTIQSVRVVGNFGYGILSDPVVGNRQNDVILYGLSVVSAVSPRVEVVGEINGRANTRSGEPPPGTDSLGQIRVGARITSGAVRFDGAVISGITPRDATIGLTAGFTWVLEGM